MTSSRTLPSSTRTGTFGGSLRGVDSVLASGWFISKSFSKRALTWSVQGAFRLCGIPSPGIGTLRCLPRFKVRAVDPYRPSELERLQFTGFDRPVNRYSMKLGFRDDIGDTQGTVFSHHGPIHSRPQGLGSSREIGAKPASSALRSVGTDATKRRPMRNAPGNSPAFAA
jgi:hypothetical protein